MSDWGATHSTQASALAGLDQEMSGSTYFGTALLQAIQKGTVPESRLDDMVLRILNSMYVVGVFDAWPEAYGNLSVAVDTPAHAALAQTLAEEGTILLKNSDRVAHGFAGSSPLLPLDPATLGSIGVVGDQNTVHGSGSGAVVAPFVISPAEGITRFLDSIQSKVNVTSHEVYTVPCVSQCANQTPTISWSDIERSVEICSSVDVCVVSVAVASGEGFDRGNLGLGYMQVDVCVC